MFQVLKKRRRLFLSRLQKYARYVFNDHFVLVLLFLLGFLLVQYRNVLTDFPDRPVFLLAGIGAVLLIVLNLGSIASYLEPADKQFLLAKETELKAWLLQAQKRSFMAWFFLQTFLILLLMPVFFKLGLSLWHSGLLLFFLAVLKWFIIQHKAGIFWTAEGRLKWDSAIEYEQKRQQSILKFFALFTSVKGLSVSVKRRSYLDRLMVFLKKDALSLWENLYWRAFLRSSDYLSLALRLLVLSLLSLIFIDNPLLAAGLALVFNYLLLFQLLALYHHFDYNYFTLLFPADQELKARNLRQFLRRIAYSMLAAELIFTFSWQGAGLLTAVMLVLTEFYLPYKIRRMID
ncbi:multidrug ABC transporter permease [Streptococcus chenjunshii]|uniref:Multidrug ABC transporter permease n=1 Tax=Streptococcus chenjunshii TaxID=2173853 RepID=A0A372KLL7_9STRE|nr:ABC transporter permease [Streptococcus chenjunshii]AXQ79461.1 multidrug ABC transporter permease [Streptococcus chenjunshii]RFU51081.1 multidrug ABC transporter permease [Streptococcus chenjunshii]RFU53179.1 multidrug ABC transporter permease [Streptococcus chenjunshii]